MCSSSIGIVLCFYCLAVCIVMLTRFLRFWSTVFVCLFPRCSFICMFVSCFAPDWRYLNIYCAVCWFVASQHTDGCCFLGLSIIYQWCQVAFLYGCIKFLVSGYSMPPLWWTAWIAIFISIPVMCIAFALVPCITCHCFSPCFMLPIMCIWALKWHVPCPEVC